MAKRLPKREQEICARLKQARELLGFTQEEFAQQVGATRQRLMNYEYKRAPLKCDLALKFCRQFLISERWLATGQGEVRQFLDLEETSAAEKIPYGALFSSAFDEFLAPVADSYLKRNPNVWYRITFHKHEENKEFLKNVLNYVFDRIHDQLPLLARHALFQRMHNAAFEWVTVFQKAREEALKNIQQELSPGSEIRKVID